MALRLRRGTDLERIGVVFEEGELVYSTDTKRLFVGDGVTAGGVPVSDVIGDQSPQLGASLDLNTYDIVGFGNINLNGDITATGTLTVPNIITDVQGSIFGDDSSPLVDGANNKIILDNNSISDLSDVNTDTVQVGDVLKWDGATWATATDSAELQLIDLTDVLLGGLQVGQFIQWDGSNWVAADVQISTLTDVDTTGLQVGDVIKWDGVNWTVTPDAGELQLADLTDVVLGGLQVGDVIKWDGVNWVADTTSINLAVSDLTDVLVSGIQIGDILKWDGSNWVADQDEGEIQLADLTDVVLGGLQVGDILKWDGATWIAGQDEGELQLEDLTDVLLGGLQVGYVIKWDGVNWVASAEEESALEDLTDVVLGFLQVGDVIKWDGSDWSSGNVAVSELSDVNLTGLQVGDLLRWNGANWSPDGGDGTILDTDIQGSVYALDSTILVDGETSKIVGDIQTSDILLQSPANQVNQIRIQKVSDQDESQSALPQGEIIFSRNDINGVTNTALIGSFQRTLYFFSDETGSFNPVGGTIMALVSGDGTAYQGGKLGLGTFSPTEKLDVRGNATVEGFMQVGKFADNTVRDNTITSPGEGMIIFNQGTQKFQGYVNDTGLAGGGASNSTPGWIDLN